MFQNKKILIKPNNIKVLIVFIWFFFFCISFSIRDFYSIGKPPIWDSLAYQLDGVGIARSILDSDSSILFSKDKLTLPIGYTLSLAIGYVLFGLNFVSPYIINSIIGLFFIYHFYLLLRYFRVDKILSLFLVMYLFSITNLFENFYLETRNDIASATFLMNFFLLFNLSIRRKSLFYLSIGSFSASLGIFFKLSSSSFLFFLYLIILFFPINKISFQEKLRAIFLSVIIVFFLVGWYLIYNFGVIYNYYTVWKDFSYNQYLLLDFKSKIFFYLVNLFKTHFTPINILYLFLLLLFFNFKIPQKTKFRLKNVLFVSICYFIPVLFLTLNHSFSSAGDTPIIPFFYLAIFIFLSLFFKFKRPFNLIPILILHLAIIIVIIFADSNSFYKKSKFSFDTFYQEVEIFRKKYFIEDPTIPIFSHPVWNYQNYNLYKEILDKTKMQNRFSKRLNLQDQISISTSLDSKKILNTVIKYDSIILPDSSPKNFGGESFVQINVVNENVKKDLIETKLFQCVKEILIDTYKFSLCLKNDYLYAKFQNLTEDGWFLWDNEFHIISLKNAKIIFNIKLLQDMDKILFVRKIDGKIFEANKILNQNNIFTFELNLPASESISVFNVKSGIEKNLIILNDPRNLAFREIEVLRSSK